MLDTHDRMAKLLITMSDLTSSVATDSLNKNLFAVDYSPKAILKIMNLGRTKRLFSDEIFIE